MSDETTLLPCICGGKAETWDGAGPWHVVCTKCGTVGSPCLTEAEAIAAWNVRTHGTLTAEQVREVLLYHLPHREYYSVEQTDAWQAIADELNATLGDERLAFLEEKVKLQGDYIYKLLKEKDELFAQNCEAATRHAGQMDRMSRELEAAALGGGKLTAEQVRKAIRKYAEDDSCYIFEVYGEMCGPIADELNAELGSGTCKITATSTNNLMYPDYMTKWYELSCGHSLTLKGDEAPKWCAVCGKVVERWRCSE